MFFVKITRSTACRLFVSRAVPPRVPRRQPCKMIRKMPCDKACDSVLGSNLTRSVRQHVPDHLTRRRIFISRTSPPWWPFAGRAYPSSCMPCCTLCGCNPAPARPISCTFNVWRFKYSICRQCVVAIHLGVLATRQGVACDGKDKEQRVEYDRGGQCRGNSTGDWYNDRVKDKKRRAFRCCDPLLQYRENNQCIKETTINNTSGMRYLSAVRGPCMSFHAPLFQMGTSQFFKCLQYWGLPGQSLPSSDRARMSACSFVYGFVEIGRLSTPPPILGALPLSAVLAVPIRDDSAGHN